VSTDVVRFAVESDLAFERWAATIIVLESKVESSRNFALRFNPEKSVCKGKQEHLSCGKN
jgi:hypothetical protein